MLSYLFLLAAATTPELPDVDLTPAEQAAIQEITTLLAQEDVSDSALLRQAQDERETQTIIITNAIAPSMLEYKHWTGKYSPETFAITINGTEIESGKTAEIPANSTTVEIGYTYSFMNGMKSGGKKISYQLNENILQANITFDWKDDWRIILDNGNAIKEVVS